MPISAVVLQINIVGVGIETKMFTRRMAYIASSSEDPEQTGHLSYSSLSSFMRAQTQHIAWQSDSVSNRDGSRALPLEDTPCRPL